MLRVTEVLFWTSLAILFYTYLGYPLLLIILVSIKKAIRRPQQFKSASLLPVTLIITAYNEEDIIEKKIANTKNINYPSSLLRVIFITDGSTDRTPALISAHPEFTLLHEPQRQGKLSAMNRAIGFANTDIILFSDANGFLNEDCIINIMPHYHNPKVGGVTGEKKVISNGGSVGEGEGLYWKYESYIKHLDSQLFTVVGAAGELFSIRRSLYIILPTDIIIEDFVQSLLLCRNGFKVKYERTAYSEETASLSIRDEMERKTRISAGAFQAMVRLKSLLNVFQYPIVTFQYISHRILRWTLCPLALVVLFVSTLVLNYRSTGPLYGILAILQIIFYIAGIVGWIYALRNKKHRLFYFAFYFLFMHFCVFEGFFRYITKRQEAVWKKASRR